MGTRNLTVVKVDGEVKVAKYGQWDGYPSGAGAEILEALSGDDSVIRLTESARNSTWATEDDIRKAYIDVGIDPDAQFVPYDDGERFERMYPTLGRDIGAGIISYMVEHPSGVKTKDSIDFADDSFCEWAYAIDLDREVLETYTHWGVKHLPKYDKGDGDWVLGDFDITPVRSDRLSDLSSFREFVSKDID